MMNVRQYIGNRIQTIVVMNIIKWICQMIICCEPASIELLLQKTSSVESVASLKRIHLISQARSMRFDRNSKVKVFKLSLEGLP